MIGNNKITEYNLKTILITGINGFLGSHLAKSLQKEYNIIGLESSTNDLFRLNGFDFMVYSSQLDYESIFQKNKIFAVLHTAVIYSAENNEFKDLINTNILLPVNLLGIANRYGCKLFINSDSFFNNINFNYSYLVEYTLSKRQVIEWLKIIKGNCKLINTKLFHLYGPGDSPKKFVTQIISVLQNNQRDIELTPGEQERDFIYVQDVVYAYQMLLKNYQKLKNHEEIEVGTGQTTSISEFVKIVKKITNSSTTLKFGALPYRENEIMYACANPEKLKSIGWNPNYSLVEGIKEIINYEITNQMQ